MAPEQFRKEQVALHEPPHEFRAEHEFQVPPPPRVPSRIRADPHPPGFTVPGHAKSFGVEAFHEESSTVCVFP